MKASRNWLLRYLSGHSGQASDLERELTYSGSEVESVQVAEADAVLEIGITSNRPDCLCHLGLAREIAAVSGCKFTSPPVDVAFGDAPTADVLSVQVENSEDCSRFCALVIEGVKVKPSSPWLTELVQSIGLRTVNNVVDITNFVMLECSQPLHAYDLDQIRGGILKVRRAAPRETLKAINGTTYNLSTGDLVIADRDRAVGMAGVMGGFDSEVSLGTTRVLLESAHFRSALVRRTAAAHQLHSDASYRFERGVARALAMDAALRAASLILSECGGVLRSKPLDVGGPGPEPSPILLRLATLKRILGIEVPPARVHSILSSLHCGVKVVGDGSVLEVLPPNFRMDLTREIDLVEEVIRLHGLDKIPVISGMPIRLVRPHPRRALREELKSRLVEHGFFETMTPDFVQDGAPAEVSILASGGALSVRNPVRSGESTLRRSLLPSLLQVRKHNYDRGNDGLSLFEIGTVHSLQSEVPAPIRESRLLGLLMDGDLRRLRGVVEDLLSRVGLKLNVLPTEHPCFEKGACASLRVEGETVAIFGIVAPELAKHVGLKSRPLYAELQLDAMLGAPGRNRRFEGLPRFPQVSRDLAVILDDSIPYQRMADAILGASPEFLVGMELFDIYRGKQVGEGKRSLALRFVFRHDERTLLGSEVDAQMSKIIAVAENDLAGSVRKS